MVRFLLFNFLLFAFNLNAQVESNNFRKISTSDGLSQSSVIAIQQDHFGQMWLGTRDGLNKYDGSTFTVYRNDPLDLNSLSNNDILTIKEDSKGNIWIGTYNGLNKYDPKKEKFTRFYHNDKPFSLRHNIIYSIEETKNGNIWVGTADGLSLYHKDSTNFKNFTDLQGLRDNDIRSLFQGEDANLWIGTAKGLCRMNRNKDEFTFQPIGPELIIQDIKEDNSGKLWIATKKRGLYTYNKFSGEFLKFNPYSEESVIHPDIREISIDKDKNIWLGTYDGLNVINTKKKQIVKITSDPNNKNSLSKNTIKSVYTDEKGSVWIGAYYGGVNIWDESNVNFQNFTHNSGNNGLSYEVVSSIQIDDNNALYFGTEGGGITKYRKGEKSVYINSTNTRNFPSDNIKSLLIQDNEKLWVGTFNAGLAVYDLQENIIKPHWIPSSLNAFLEGTSIYSLKMDNRQNIWIGTFGKGLIIYNKEKESFINFTENSEIGKSLSSNNIRSLLIEPEGAWIGTESGLNRLPLHNYIFTDVDEMEYYFYDKDNNTGEDILTLFKDSEDRVWVGTKYQGLFLFNGNGFKSIKLNIKSKRITAIHSILEDDNKNLWLSTNQGLISYNPNNKTASIYHQNDGLISNEFNDNSSLKVSSTLYFGGPSGVSSFNPNDLVQNPYAPKVLLTDFKVQNESIKKQDFLDSHITYTQSLTLDYTESNFTINFAIPNFINPNSNRYAYRLIGLDDQWITTSNTEANYTIQNAGTYKFEVKGANNDGVWSEEATQLEITILPAPWKSPWAFALYALLISLALWGLIWIMKSKANLSHRLEIQKMQSEKNREINQAKLQFFTDISHDFKTPLTLILGPLQQLLMDYHGSNKMYKKLLVIESSANHLLQLINRLMDFRKLENKQYRLEAAEGNIVKFLKEIFLSFSEYARDGGYNYNFLCEEERILLFYDRPKLEGVFYNLISNAFRYTPKGGEITVEIKKNQEEVSVCVRDSGIGIPKEKINKIFDRFYEIENEKKVSDAYNKGTGIGLSIAKNIVQLHKGKIWAESIEEKGSAFKVCLRLGDEHLSQTDLKKDFKFSDDISQYEDQLEAPNLLKGDFEELVLDKDKATILVVEDNDALRSFIKNLLSSNYNIIEAPNGRVAMNQVLKNMPDLVISDVIMPEMVGTDLCANIKENLSTSHIPVILLTSRSSLVYKFEGLESGADDYISKPFDVKEFQLRVKNLLESTQRLKNRFSKNDIFKPEDLVISSRDEELLKKALEVVEKNISNDKFNIPTFCAELGVSRTMLFNKIKAWTNFTPNEFITEIRMKRAAQLLEQGKINISQVSYKVGFGNPKYFTKCFQKKYGLTPTEYSNKFYDDTIGVS